MLVIGLTGLAGSGKSTVANHLIEKHGFERGKFANALKEMLRTLLRYRGATEALIERMIEGDLKETSTALLNGRSPRHAMLTLGTEWGRDLIDRDLWVDTEVASVKSRRPNALIFDDVRFPNEVDAIYRLGGKIWRIARRREDLNTSAGSHSSEQLDVVADREFVNNATKAELRAIVDMNLSVLKLALAKRAA